MFSSLVLCQLCFQGFIFMAANNEQGIQLEYLSKIDIKQTNEWLDSVTVEQIAALNDEPFDGSIYSKLLNLPAIEDPKGLTDVFWLEGVNSPMMFFKDLLDKKRQLIRCHVLMAIIMLDKGPKGIVRTPEQEQEFFEIFKKIKELDLKAQKLDTLAFIFFKKFLADTFVFQDIERDFVFNVDALFMHSVNFVEELILFEQSLPDWWKINKIVIDSKAYLPHCINLSAGGLCMGFHPGDSVSDFYQKRFGEISMNSASAEAFNRTVIGLDNFQVCPDVLKLFPNLRRIYGAKPSSANKKSHQKLMAKIQEENLVDFYTIRSRDFRLTPSKQHILTEFINDRTMQIKQRVACLARS